MKKKRTTEKTIGHHIKIARKHANLTPEQLARKINMRTRFIEDIENDTITQLDAGILHRIAIAVGKGTIADLLKLPIKTRGGWK